MHTTSITYRLTIGLMAASLLPLVTAEPNAEQILRQMSAKLP